jgi:cytochrome c553
LRGLAGRGYRLRRMNARFWMTAVLLAGCAAEPKAEVGGTWFADVEAPPPTWITETGIFADASALEPAEGFVPYEPPFPLWTNGSGKYRLLYLPPGARVDTSSPDAWRFPVGTVLVKTFAYDGLEGQDGEAPVETRLLFRRRDGWAYALYQWGADGREARLMGERWAGRTLKLPAADGGTVEHTLPGLLDCKACHETNRGEAVIGLSRINLDPQLPATFFTQAPETPAPAGRTPAEQAAMDYFVGNCVHCHHGETRGDNASFSLLPEDLVESTVNKPTEASASGAGVRVVPGDPEGSAIFEAVVKTRREGYRGEFKAMPPLGWDVIDGDAEGILRDWIGSL